MRAKLKEVRFLYPIILCFNNSKSLIILLFPALFSPIKIFILEKSKELLIIDL